MYCFVYLLCIEKIYAVARQKNHQGSFHHISHKISIQGAVFTSFFNVLILLSLTLFRIVIVPKKVPHPNIISFKEKMTNLEPEFSPYYCKFSKIDRLYQSFSMWV